MIYKKQNIMKYITKENGRKEWQKRLAEEIDKK